MELRELIGIPFVYKGRDIKGCDCFGLVKLYYDNFTDIRLNGVEYDKECELNVFEKELKKEEFEEAEGLRIGDLLVFLYNEKNVHLGVVVKEGLMLMATPKTGSVMVNSTLWKKKVYKILRAKNV